MSTRQRLFSPVTLGFGILCFILLTSFGLNARFKPCNEMNYLLRASCQSHVCTLFGWPKKNRDWYSMYLIWKWLARHSHLVCKYHTYACCQTFISLSINISTADQLSWYQPGVSVISLSRQPGTYSYWYCLWSFSEWIIQYVKDGAEFLFQLNLQLEVWIFREIDLDTTNSYRNNTSQPLNIQPS